MNSNIIIYHNINSCLHIKYVKLNPYSGYINR